MSGDKVDFLFIASNYKPLPGGIAAYLDSLIRGLVDLGQSVRVLGLAEQAESDRLRFLATYEPWVTPVPFAYDRQPGTPVRNKVVSLLEIMRCWSPSLCRVLNRTRFLRASARSMQELRLFLAKHQPEMVVFGHLDIGLYSLVLVLLEANVPYGIIGHDSEIRRNPRRVNDLTRRGLMLKNARWIAANSQHTKSLIREWGIPDDRIILVHPPLSQGALEQSSVARPLADSDSYRLVSVCRVVRAKGIDIALQAVATLIRRGIQCRYVIAGEGPERERLQGMATELGISDCVQFAGFVPEQEKWALLRSSDVFVMPSRVSLSEQHEGFGLAFIEANACGIPAVGTNAGGIPDAIVDGVTGILVEPESPERLAHALMMLHRNPKWRTEMGEAGMQRAKTEFSARCVATRFLEGIASISRSRDRQEISAVFHSGIAVPYRIEQTHQSRSGQE